MKYSFISLVEFRTVQHEALLLNMFVVVLLQAKPNEYVPSLLAHQTPISFHRHNDLDPLTVYKDYLS